ncbi:MAG: histidine kinase [Microlunatus sp.]|nr:histidine kinase [Microlunatus sp.]
MRSAHALARGSRSLDLALLQFAVASLLLVVINLILLRDSDLAPYPILALFVLLGVIYCAAGLVAWRRRPGNRMGVLLTGGGLVQLVVSLANVDVPGLVAIGQVAATLPLAVIVHLLLAFPSGRLRGLAPLIIVLTGYGVSLVLQAPKYLFRPETPPSPLFIGDRPGVVAVADTAQTVAGAAVMIATAIVLVHRLLLATPAQRRVLIPLNAYGIVAVIMLPVGGTLLRSLGIDQVTAVITQILIVAVLPIAFAFSVLRGGFARTGELDELAAWLSSGPHDRSQLAVAVGQALGDPTVTVGYTIDEGPPVDSTGRRVDPRPGRRGLVDVDIEGRQVATISYDAELITDSGHVARAGRLVAIELDRERLTADLLARREELHQSRLRIVAEADQERRRIAQDLHDGLQAQLVLLSLVAGKITADERSTAAELRGQTDQLRRELDTTAADLRRLAHGLMPAILVERGLFAAARDFVDLLPISTELTLHGEDAALPEVVETTAYFVLAEALTNAIKYAHATRIDVQLDRDDTRVEVRVRDDGVGGAVPEKGRGGLRGLADRVTVLGGRLVVESSTGTGTRIYAEVPCVP